MFNEGFRGERADPYCVKVDVDRANNCLSATVFYLDGFVHSPKEIESFKFQDRGYFLEKIRQYNLNAGHIECLEEDAWIGKECLLSGARFEQGEKSDPYSWIHAC